MQVSKINLGESMDKVEKLIEGEVAVPTSIENLVGESIGEGVVENDVVQYFKKYGPEDAVLGLANYFKELARDNQETDVKRALSSVYYELRDLSEVADEVTL